IFLSPAPQNRPTRCFTGMFEMLGPVRSSKTSELKPAERVRIQQSVIRRLNRDINAKTKPPKFAARRPPQALVLQRSPKEAALSGAFDQFRKAVREFIAQGDRRRRRAGSFAVEIFGKRLLSCPTTFAESWRHSQE